MSSIQQIISGIILTAFMSTASAAFNIQAGEWQAQAIDKAEGEEVASNTVAICFSQEIAANFTDVIIHQAQSGECQQKIVEDSSKKLVLTLHCKGENSAGDVRIEAVKKNNKELSAKTLIDSKQDGQKQQISREIRYTFRNASCSKQAITPAGVLGIEAPKK